MPTIRPHLWFGNDQAVEAARFYAENIPDSSVDRVLQAPADLPGAPAGSDFIVEFTVLGMPVIGLNAGPHFTLDEAFSFYLLVDTQEEVDHYWDLLTADGGEPSACGWCKDKFGVSWQVIPRQVEELCGEYATEANLRAADALMQMGKIDIATLEAAYAGDGVDDEPELVEVDEATTAVIAAVVATEEMPTFFDRAFSTLPAVLASQGVAPVGAAFARHRRAVTDTADLEVGFAVDRPIEPEGDVRPSTLPGGRVARFVHRGAFDGLPDAWARLDAWISRRGLATRGDVWEVYLTEPSPDMDPADLRTELNWPVE